MQSFITEKQFNMLHDLLRLCDDKGVPRELQFHLVRNLQSSLYMERDLQSFFQQFQENAFPFVGAVPRKICLFTDGQGYGPWPEDDDPIQQRISLTDKGNVTITFYNYNHKRLLMERRHVEAEKAAALIREIAYRVVSWPPYLRVTDVGSWDLTVTTDCGTTVAFHGDMIENALTVPLSEQLRQLLQDPALLCFDGENGQEKKYRICSCKIGSSEKEYHYRSDDPAIQVGDTVIAPVGGDGRLVFAVVTAVDYLSEDELFLPIDQLKVIEKAVQFPAIPDGGNPNASLFDVVKRAIDITDCECLLEIGCPADEYDGESSMIADRLRPHMDKYQIASVIAEVMTSQFDTPYPIEPFLAAAEYIEKDRKAKA